MPDDQTAPHARFQLPAAGLDSLHAELTAAGYRVIGPQVRGDAIVLGELATARRPPVRLGSNAVARRLPPA